MSFLKFRSKLIDNLQSLTGQSKLSQEKFLYRHLPSLLAEIITRYFKVEIEGLENIPRQGPVIIAPNHSGFSGFDAIVLAYMIQKHAQRIPRVLTHQFWFLTKTTALPANKMGFIEASYENGKSYLNKNNLIILFPEGEHGNFKPSHKMYELQEFKRGFVRLALETKAVIVPTLVIGAEESSINLSQLKLSKFFRGLILPLPLNILPLPVKWKIKFLPPRELPYDPNKMNDRELVKDLCNEIQEEMQETLSKEIKIRKK
ncbi:MAG: lysophospholipid acyltransferase family protein [Pseudobdellovibrionaceae bacterium]